MKSTIVSSFFFTPLLLIWEEKRRKRSSKLILVKLCHSNAWLLTSQHHLRRNVTPNLVALIHSDEPAQHHSLTDLHSQSLAPALSQFTGENRPLLWWIKTEHHSLTHLRINIHNHLHLLTVMNRDRTSFTHALTYTITCTHTRSSQVNTGLYYDDSRLNIIHSFITQ